MVYQLYEISDTYFEGKEKIDIKFSNEFKFPKMFLSFIVSHNELLTKHLYSDLFNNLKIDNIKQLVSIFNNLKFVLTKNTTHFKYITGFDNISIKCNINSNDKIIRLF